ncbi:MAG: hypothetical protein HXO31_02000 [Prevotella sp.]|jgi:hypothetical protein|uniref:hypothetical protein n=1 Tax=Prevotella sp. TaxID=59823 RepID=UPI001CABB9BA|nr:hypothetical protein [Prevotella sp.]MBF1581827.1 hypothetical protein [Prevotella sp.]MBF1598553.1 hypothetical protein [Prevotella sp.]
MEKNQLTIVGKIDNMVVERRIMNYRKDIPEELLTTKKDICDEFARHGYNPNEVIFF